MFRIVCIFLILFIYFRCSPGLEIDHWGTHFVMSFLKNYGSPIENVVVITTREKADVRVSSFGATGQILEVSLAAHQSHRINFAEGMMITSFYRVLEKKAVLIESSTKISVYGFSYKPQHSSADGFLVLPIPTLGLEYMAVNLDDKAQLAVIAVEDVTVIKIILKVPNTCSSDGSWKSFAAGSQHTFTMAAYDVISMYCVKHMTGSLVSSDKPVAILTGNECVSLPSTASCDHVVEMLPPVNQFGDEFVVVPPYGHSYDATLRVVALVDDTTFFIKGSDRVLTAGSYTDFVIIPYDNICFRSSKPVMAVIFMRGPSRSDIRYYRGDAFMMYIPPTQKYTTQYVFDANALEPYTTWVIVIMRDIFKSTITPSIPDIQLINNCWGYSKDIIGVDELIHYSSNNPFGILMYGYDNKEAYGYPAGLKLTDYSEVEECANSPCQNGGWCLEVGLSYRCHCLTRFSGDHCEIDVVDDCVPYLCNQGICVDGFLTYTCNCTTGYTGLHCEIAIPTTTRAATATIPTTTRAITTTIPTTTRAATTIIQTATSAITTTIPTTTRAATTTIPTTTRAITTTTRAAITTILKTTETNTIRTATTTIPTTTRAATTTIPKTTRAITTTTRAAITTMPKTTETNTTIPTTTRAIATTIPTTTRAATTTTLTTTGATTAILLTTPETETTIPIESVTTVLMTTEPETLNTDPTQLRLWTNFTETTEKLPTEVTASTTVVTSSTGAPFIPKPLFLKPPCIDRLCMCQCPCATNPRSRSDAELLTRTQPKLILLAKETLSKTKRLKYSWPNVNQSEVTLGSSAIIILMMFILLILLLDISKMCKEGFKKISVYQESAFVP